MLDERKEGDPLEGARVMLMGTCAKVLDCLGGGPYLHHHPDAELFAGFGDFAFYHMEISRTRSASRGSDASWMSDGKIYSWTLGARRRSSIPKQMQSPT